MTESRIFWTETHPQTRKLIHGVIDRRRWRSSKVELFDERRRRDADALLECGIKLELQPRADLSRVWHNDAVIMRVLHDKGLNATNLIERQIDSYTNRIVLIPRETASRVSEREILMLRVWWLTRQSVSAWQYSPCVADFPWQNSFHVSLCRGSPGTDSHRCSKPEWPKKRRHAKHATTARKERREIKFETGDVSRWCEFVRQT